MQLPGAGRPYARYCSNGRDTVHVIVTEDHPRNFDNSIYHGFFRAGLIHRSDGSVAGKVVVVVVVVVLLSPPLSV